MINYLLSRQKVGVIIVLLISCNTLAFIYVLIFNVVQNINKRTLIFIRIYIKCSTDFLILIIIQTSELKPIGQWVVKWEPDTNFLKNPRTFTQKF